MAAAFLYSEKLACESKMDGLHSDVPVQSLELNVLGHCSPLSEMFGRVMILSAASIFYVVFNTLCGIAKTQNQLIAYRFLAGLGGAGPFGVCVANVFLVYEC